MKLHACFRFAFLLFAALGWLACKDNPPCPPWAVPQGDTCVAIDRSAGLCLSGAEMCGKSCAFVENDNNHCGSCNRACAGNQHCADGQCLPCERESRVYAACFATGEVAVLSSATRSLVERQVVGDKPQALGGKGEVLLCADDGAQQLLRLNAQTLQPVGDAVRTGETPIHVSISGAYVYVVNAGSNTLQLVDTQDKPDSTWMTVGEVSFGPNTSPQSLALFGNQGFVPLYGNLMSGETSVGQRLSRINLSNPASPELDGAADFTSLHLQSYPGRKALPLPYDVVRHQDALYVALNNLDVDAKPVPVPAGPGLIAKVEPQSMKSSVLSLGDTCRNVTTLASNGKQLVASCAGDWGTTPGVAGLALLEDDKVQDTWAAPPGFSPGSLAFKCDELWVANANGGDVFLFSVQGKRLQLLRGEGGSEGGPVETCPLGPVGYSVVQSLWLKP